MIAAISAPPDADFLKLRNEFVAMPGLCVTVRQAARLLSVTESRARALLERLVAEGLLVRTGGLYRRVPR